MSKFYGIIIRLLSQAGSSEVHTSEGLFRFFLVLD